MANDETPFAEGRGEAGLPGLADALQAGANYVRDHDAAAVLASVERFVRDNPGKALGIAFGGGLLLSGMLRSGIGHGSSEGPTDRVGGPHDGDLDREWQRVSALFSGVAAKAALELLHEAAPHLKSSAAPASPNPSDGRKVTRSNTDRRRGYSGPTLVPAGGFDPPDTA